MEDIDNYSVDIDEQLLDNDYDDVDVIQEEDNNSDTNIQFE